MNCLLVANTREKIDQEIISLLRTHHVDYEMVDDSYTAIQKAHENLYDVVVLNAEETGGHIDSALRILKECNPRVRIIVRTEENSIDLELAVRKANIFYYHLNSFGAQEITAALSSALEFNVNRLDSLIV